MMVMAFEKYSSIEEALLKTFKCNPYNGRAADNSCWQHCEDIMGNSLLETHPHIYVGVDNTLRGFFTSIKLGNKICRYNVVFPNHDMHEIFGGNFMTNPVGGCPLHVWVTDQNNQQKDIRVPDGHVDDVPSNLDFNENCLKPCKKFYIMNTNS